MDRFARRTGMVRRLLPLLACVCLGLAAAQPLLVTARLPQGYDAFFHLHRLIEVDTLLREGIVFSRWAPDLARGFGYPLFNYYAPLSYYLPEALHLLGLPIVEALLGGFVLLMVCSALAMYAWTRDLFGEGAAIVAAAAYVFSPYTIANLVTRTVFAEIFAVPLLPLLMFGVSRLLATGRRRYAALATLSLAGLALGHNVTAALFLPLTVVYVVVWQVAVRLGAKVRGDEPGGPRATRLVWAASAVLAALCLTAFFWLPVLAERNLVQLGRLAVGPWFGYRDYLVGPGQIFALPLLEDPLVLDRGMVPYSLSPVAGLLALVGVLGFRRWRPSRAQAAQIGAAALAACAALFMITPASAPVLGLIPQMQALQFPWRFLGVASPFVALLAGAGLRAIEGRAEHRGALNAVLLPVLVCALLAWVFPWQDVSNFYPPLGNLTIEDVARYERKAEWYVGTTTTGEYLPVAVRQYPPPEPSTPGDDRARLDLASLPEGAQILSADYRSLEYRLTIQTPSPFVAVFNTFQFAGWRAWVDGAETSITPTDPYGLISVPLPAGTHELRVRFGATPARICADAISLLSVVVLAGVAVLPRLRRRWRRRERGAERRPALQELTAAPADGFAAGGSANPTLRLAAGPALATIVLVVAAFACKSLFFDPNWVGYRRARLAVVSDANFANRLTLMGADRPPVAVPGRPATVVLYWRVPAKTDAEYSPTAYLVDAQGIVLARADNQHPSKPTRTWPVGRYARDSHAFDIPTGTPPGRYAVHVGAYPYGKPDQALDVLDAGGAPAGRSVELTTLEVVRPERPPREDELQISTRLDSPLGAGLVLMGCDPPAGQVRTGGSLRFNLYWKATAAIGAGHTVQLQLLDATGTVAWRQDVAPVPGYDTGQWQPGDIWRGAFALTIPARLSGQYTLAVAGMGEPAAALGEVDIEAPTHQFSTPRLAYAQQGTFADLVSLVGYDLAGELQPGQEILVTLVWRAERESVEHYKTFVHLLRADGSLLAGSDAVPGNWQRPTPSWVEGEYIADPHRLQVPGDIKAGTYRLEVGLYDSTTLKRLPVGDGSDALFLSQTLNVGQ